MVVIKNTLKDYSNKNIYFKVFVRSLRIFFNVIVNNRLFNFFGI